MMSNVSHLCLVLALVGATCSPALGRPPADALADESRLEFLETPLEQIIGFLFSQHRATFLLDPRVDGTEPITADARGSLEKVLTDTLRPLNLTYRVQGDVIVIAPTDEAVYRKRLRDKPEQERLAREREQDVRKTLQAANARLVEDGFGWIGQVQLAGGNVSDRVIASVRQLPRLTCLDLSGTALTDEGIAQLKGLDRLAVLRVGGTKISDAGLPHLRAHARLQALDLSKTVITDDRLQELADIPGLQAVLVEGTRTTANGVARLQKQLPRIRFLTERPNPAKRQPDGLNPARVRDPFEADDRQVEEWFAPPARTSR